MGYIYSGDAVLGVSLNVNTPKPLDIRAVVSSTQDLYSIPESTAYVGMTVANIADGNIYMLIDKSNITNKLGWKASYESIQIIACTHEEYKQWLENTEINGEMFSPKEEALPFIHANTYYYLYEDSIVEKDEDGNVIKDSQEYYVTRSWIEEALKNKANSGDVETITSGLNELNSNIENNYVTKERLREDYDLVTIDQLNAKLQYLIDQLNSKLPDLNLTLNPQPEP